MRMCFDKRVLIGLGVVALGVLAVAPQLLGSVAPLLILAACPLSMVFMMRAMDSKNGQGASSCTPEPHDREAAAGGRGDQVPAGTGPAARDQDAQLRELQEEVNLLKAEAHLRSQAPKT